MSLAPATAASGYGLLHPLVSVNRSTASDTSDRPQQEPCAAQARIVRLPASPSARPQGACRPRIVDMRDLVLRQHGEIVGMQEVLVPDFDAVWPTLRNFCQGTGRVRPQIPHGQVAGVEVAELEQSRPTSGGSFARLNERSGTVRHSAKCSLGLPARTPFASYLGIF